jgi:hypothetical protein
MPFKNLIVKFSENLINMKIDISTMKIISEKITSAMSDYRETKYFPPIFIVLQYHKKLSSTAESFQTMEVDKKILLSLFERSKIFFLLRYENKTLLIRK